MLRAITKRYAATVPELKRAVHGISDSVLADRPSNRLTELGWAGLVERCVGEGPPIAVSYGLTPAGQALLPCCAG